MNDRVEVVGKESGSGRAVQVEAGQLGRDRQAYERLRALSVKLLDIQEEERRRIAAELHDGLGQTLSIINFGIEEARLGLDSEAVAESRDRLAVLCGQIRGAIDELRQVSTDLRPSILDDFGIVATLTWFFREFKWSYPDISVRQEISVSETEVPVKLKTTLFRIVQDGMHNIAQHVNRASLCLRLTRENGVIVLSIEDEEASFALASFALPSAAGQGGGLIGLHDRVLISGGECQMVSRAGLTRLIRVSWPI